MHNPREDRGLSFQTTQAPAADAEAARTKISAAQQNDLFTSEALLEAILASLTSDKAEDIVSIDLKGKSSIADAMVVCSGRSSRQVAAIAEKLAERLKATFKISVRMEGKDTGDWVLIDASDVIVHVFRPEVREFYQLEKMWAGTSEPAT